MNEEERDFTGLDPANLLPFERMMEPENPNVERLPKQYVGTDELIYG